jgi:dihydroneopterin aldolase
LARLDVAPAIRYLDVMKRTSKASESSDTLRIDGLRVDCIVGVYPHERDRPQPLVVDLALSLDTRPAVRGGGLKKSIDYARLSAEIRFLLEGCRFLLLETAAEAIARYVLAPATPDRPHAYVDACSVRLTKPEALGGARASLEVHRRASDMRYTHEEKPFGTVDILAETSECGIYRLRIAPGRTIPTHVHRTMEETELVLGSGLLLQGAPVAPGTAFAWPREFPHRYDNKTAIEQSILCIDRPRFIPDDEIEVGEVALAPAVGERLYPTGDLEAFDG